MDRLTLIVKGDCIAALQAAEDHGARRCRVVNHIGKPTVLGPGYLTLEPGGRGASLISKDSTTISCCMPWDEAARWLAEPPYAAPYPCGALLCYREAD